MAKKLSKKNAKARRELKEELEQDALKIYVEGRSTQGHLQVEYAKTGNFTFVNIGLIRDDDTFWANAFSKYNPNDEKLGYPYSEERGLQIALGRACADIARQVYP